MHNHEFIVGQILIFKQEEDRADVWYRIVSRHPNGGVILYELPSSVQASHSHSLKLSSYSIEFLHDLLCQKSILVATSDPYLPSYRPPTLKETEEADQPVAATDEGSLREEPEDKQCAEAMALVDEILHGDVQSILDRNDRIKIIARVAKAAKTYPRYLYRLLNRYFTCGMTPTAVRSFAFKRGGKGQIREPGDCKRGKKAKFKARSGCNVTPEMRQRIQEHARKELTKGKRTVKELHDSFCVKEHLDGHEVKDGVKLPKLKSHENKITLASFKKYYYRDRHPTDSSRLLHGPRHELEHRELLGSETARALYAGAIFAGDFTLLDVQANGTASRHPIGRPTYGQTVDIYTMMRMGMLLTMSNPSALQAMLLLENSFSDKVAFCAQYGITITSDEWPGGFICEEALFDNGELRGKAHKLIARNLGIQFTNTAPYRPEEKGSIESSIGHVTGKEIRLLPGYVPRDRQRGDPKCECDGFYDLPALIKILILASLHRNSEWINDHHQGIYARMDGIDPRPLAMFKHSILTGSGALRKAPSPDVLRALLFPRGRAKITAKGLFFKGLYYFDEAMLASGAFVEARRSGLKYIDVVYDPRLIDAIYLVPDPKEPRIVTCPLGDRSKHLAGHKLNFADMAALQHDHEFRQADATDSDQQTRVDLKAEMNAIDEDQKDKNNAAKKIVRSFAPKNKRKARALAAQDGEKEDARILNDKKKDGKIIPLKDSSAGAGVEGQAPSDVRNESLNKFYGES